MGAELKSPFLPLRGVHYTMTHQQHQRLMETKLSLLALTLAGPVCKLAYSTGVGIPPVFENARLYSYDWRIESRFLRYDWTIAPDSCTKIG